MDSASAAENDAAQSLDNVDESVSVPVRVLEDTRNSRPQPLSSDSSRTYNIPHSPCEPPLCKRLPDLQEFRPSPGLFDLSVTTSFGSCQRRESSRFCCPYINGTSCKHYLASLRTNKTKLGGCQSMIFPYPSKPLPLLLCPTSMRVDLTSQLVWC